MKTFYLTISILLLGLVSSAQNLLNNPESVVYDPVYDRYLVSNWEDGNIIEIDNNNNQQYFSTVLEQSAGLHIANDTLYAASTYGSEVGLVGFDLTTGEIICRVDIPEKELLNDITSDNEGNFYVTDCDANKIYKIRVSDSTYTTFVDSGLGYPNGIIFEQENDRLLVLNGGLPGRPIIAVNIEDSTTSVIIETNKNAIDGLTVDSEGNYYFSSWGSDCVFMYDETFTNPPEVISSGHTDPADIFINTQRNILAVPNFNSNIVDFIPLGSVIHVPDDQPTIQDGINDAMNGDTVLVAPGTYFENINFNGKNIVVTSHFIIDKETEFIHNTKINGSDPQNSDTASCIRFVSGENNSAQLSGFTICGGTGTHWVDPQYPSWTWHSGGGVFIFNSSPTISYNIIHDNHVDDPMGADGASGGGLCTFGGNPIIYNSIISENTALYGAGIVIDYSGCELKNNIISWNTGGQSYGGGGIWTIGNSNDPIILENNTIANNEVFDGGLGGAMYLWSTNMTARNNIIYFNFQPTGTPIYLKEGSTLDISYSNVEGGYDGEGNIDQPPAYADFNYVLQPTSPCVDAGNPDPQFHDPEDSSNPGSALWPSLGSLTNDMGVYGGSGSFFLPDSPIGIKEINIQKGELGFSVNCFPNPMNKRIEIHYVVSYDKLTKLIISDMLGRPVNVIVDKIQKAGEYTITWNGEDKNGDQSPSGIYFCSLESGNRKVVSKITKLD